MSKLTCFTLSGYCLDIVMYYWQCGDTTENRQKRGEGLLIQAQKMKDLLNQDFLPVSVVVTVRVQIPEFDRAKIDLIISLNDT